MFINPRTSGENAEGNYTGGNSLSVSGGDSISLEGLCYAFLRYSVPFIVARRYFRFLRSSWVGRALGPTRSRISCRNLFNTPGFWESIYSMNVRVDAV